MAIENFDRRPAAGIKWSFLGLAFFLPLLVSTRSSEVFELPKMLFAYAMTAVICGLWLSRMVLRRQILIRRTPLDIPILLFLISQMVSTIYSIDPHVSWWGWYGRFHGGLASTAAYTLLYYALVSNTSGTYKGLSGRTVKPYNGKTVIGKPVRQYTSYRSTDYRLTVSLFHRFLIKAILSSALLVSLYAILQHFGVDKDFWVQDVVNRVFSTQGQPNWLAAYLVMTIPVVFAMIISSSLRGVSPKAGRRGDLDKIATLPSVARNDGKISIVSYFLFLIYFLALLWTKSRSGLLGLAVADLVFWSLIFFQFYLLKKRSYIDQQRSFKKEPTFLGTKRLYRLSTIVHNLYNFVNRDKDRKKVTLVNLAKPFILIHILMAGFILATNNPAREWIFQKSRLISAKISSPRFAGEAGSNQITDKSDKSESDLSDLSTIRSSADVSRNSDFSGITPRKSEFGGTESGDIRRIVWNGAIQLVKQRPIFGFGPETFGETYWRVRSKEHNLTSEWNFLYNKAHNEWLNLAANTGLFGLGSHLLLLTWFSVWTLRSFANFSGAEKFAKLNYFAAILAGLWGVEIVNFFGFSTVTIGTYRYLFMAAAVVIAAADDDVNKLLKSPPDRQHSSVIKTGSKLLKSIADRAATSVIQMRKNINLWKKFILAALSLFVLYLISQFFIFFFADLSYNRGRAYQDGGYIQEAVEPLIQAVNLAPGEPVFRAELGEAEGAAAALLRQRTENSELILELKNDSMANFEIIRKQSPYNLGFIRTQAKILFLLGEQDKAAGLMKAAMAMAPTNPQLPYSLGIMLDRMGKTEEAILYYNKALKLKPDYTPALEKL